MAIGCKCTTSEKIYPPEIPIKDCRLPKYLPQQFGPYFDNDPNSVIKYKDIPVYLTSRLQVDIENKELLKMEVKNRILDDIIEQFPNQDGDNYITLLITIIVLATLIMYFIKYSSNK